MNRPSPRGSVYLVVCLIPAFLLATGACSPADSESADGGIDDGAVDTGPYSGPTTAAWAKGTHTSDSNLSFTRSFAVHKNKTYLGFGYTAGSSNGGLLVTADDGANWTEISLPPVGGPTNNKYPVTFVASDQSRLYVVTGIASDILASDDDGATWTTLPFVSNYPAVQLIVIGGKLYAAAGGGVFVSVDKGATWSQVVTGDAASIVEVQGAFYVGWNKGVWYAPEGDFTTRTEVNTGLLRSGVKEIVVAGTTLFLLTTENKLYQAEARGALTEWTLTRGVTGVADIFAYQSALFCIHSGGEIRMGLQLTTDKGATWLPFDSGLPSRLEMIGAGRSNLFVATPNAVYRTVIK